MVNLHPTRHAPEAAHHHGPPEAAGQILLWWSYPPAMDATPPAGFFGETNMNEFKQRQLEQALEAVRIEAEKARIKALDECLDWWRNAGVQLGPQS